jgi:hypothetical protein
VLEVRRYPQGNLEKNPPHIHSGSANAPSRSAPKPVKCDLVGATGDADAAPNSRKYHYWLVKLQVI